MDNIFINVVNIKISDPPRVLFNLTNKINLKRSNIYVPLSNSCILYTWENMKQVYENSKYEMSVPMWNDKLELPDGSYSV